jgi:tRNA pseudouridine55 synthase
MGSVKRDCRFAYDVSLMPHGLLLIDKPAGPTSHDVVATVRRGAGEKRVGHAGTLDPLATGLLVLCLGAATRLSEYLIAKDKAYTARVRFGVSTNTYDADGAVTATGDVLPTRERVEATLAQFRGTFQQQPPAFSAIKRGGQKAYELARRGETVALEPRSITVYQLQITGWSPPDCTLDVTCSAGTYIRSLAHDLGQALGCGAHLAALRRIGSGHFQIEEAVALEALKAAFAAKEWQRYLLPMDSAVRDWPEVHLTERDARRIYNGQSVPMTANSGDEFARAYNPAGAFFAVLRAEGRVWRPHKVLLT